MADPSSYCSITTWEIVWKLQQVL